MVIRGKEPEAQKPMSCSTARIHSTVELELQSGFTDTQLALLPCDAWPLEDSVCTDTDCGSAKIHRFIFVLPFTFSFLVPC